MYKSVRQIIKNNITKHRCFNELSEQQDQVALPFPTLKLPYSSFKFVYY